MTNPIGLLFQWSRALVAVALLSVLGACSSEEGDHYAPSVVFERTQSTHLIAPGYKNTAQLLLRGVTGTPYTITIVEGEEWCSTKLLTPTTIKHSVLYAGAGTVEFLYIDANRERTAPERRATILVAYESGELFTLTIDQEPYSVPENYDRAWAELPAYLDDDNFRYVTHYAPISANRTVRNFTLCYDTEKCIANWVAYPLHKIYMNGTYVRTDEWAYDPKIPTNEQADLTRGSYRGGVRGHQCMSNHRYNNYSLEMNEQTFYSTNIMPQNYDFNSGSWNDMENICSRQICADTLYVVTGTHDVASWGSDKAGKRVAVPKYCWKVLLRTKAGNTGKRISEITSASELKAIGYWAANSSASETGLKEYIVSVQYIEEQTGFQFFPMLQESIASAVKQQNKPSDWGIN